MGPGHRGLTAFISAKKIYPKLPFSVAFKVYDRVIKIVSPKKAKLAEAETELARQMDKLNEKRAQLQQVKKLREVLSLS